MLPAFKNILVPVDFSLNTEVAISKTLELIDGEKSVIHLLHVSRPPGFNRKVPDDYGEKLNQWKATIEDYDPSICVRLWIEESSSVQNIIREKAEELRPDLIVIGQASSHYWLPILKTVLPMRLAASTNIPVLTVKPGSLHNKAKTVVVPIADEIPDIKLQALEMLCRKVRLNIHLVTFLNERHVPTDFSASALLQVFQSLKTRLHCPVEYAVIHGPNRARAILQYTAENNADMLLVYPQEETQLNWWNQQISDVLPASSKVQILAVQPAIN